MLRDKKLIGETPVEKGVPLPDEEALPCDSSAAPQRRGTECFGRMDVSAAVATDPHSAAPAALKDPAARRRQNWLPQHWHWRMIRFPIAEEGVHYFA